MSFKWQYWTTNITAVHHWVCKNANNYILTSIWKSKNKYLVWSLDDEQKLTSLFLGVRCSWVVGSIYTAEAHEASNQTIKLPLHVYIYIWLHCRDGGEAGGCAWYLWDFNAKLELDETREIRAICTGHWHLCVFVCVWLLCMCIGVWYLGITNGRRLP